MNAYTVIIELEDRSTVYDTVQALTQSEAEEIALDRLDARVRNYVLTYWAELREK